MKYHSKKTARSNLNEFDSKIDKHYKFFFDENIPHYNKEHTETILLQEQIKIICHRLPYKLCRSGCGAAALISVGIAGFGIFQESLPLMAISGLAFANAAITGIKFKSFHNHVWENNQKLKLVQNLSNVISEEKQIKKLK